MRRPVGNLVRRAAVGVAIVFSMTVAIPERIDAGNGGFPISWLWSWASARPAWSASAFVGRPVQMRGTGLSRGHYVSAAETKAGGGSGKAPDRVSDGLEPYEPHEVQLNRRRPGARCGASTQRPAGRSIAGRTPRRRCSPTQTAR